MLKVMQNALQKYFKGQSNEEVTYLYVRKGCLIFKK